MLQIKTGNSECARSCLVVICFIEGKAGLKRKKKEKFLPLLPDIMFTSKHGNGSRLLNEETH